MLFKRGYAFYDHGVVSLYGVGVLFLIATGLLLAAAAMAPLGFTFAGWVSPVVFLALAAHMVAHLKGAYALSWPGAVFRGLALGFASLIAFALFVVGVVALGLFA